jgi:O-antigen/teichoic acid export membrane protein
MARVNSQIQSSKKLSSDLTNRLLRGGLTLTAARLLSRGFDLARMLTIARWLGPDEMGVYAVAALALTALDQFSETGLRSALIQRPGELSAYLLPVRTLQIVRGLLLGGIVFLGAPWLAAFFDSPPSLAILRVMALLPVIKGFEPLFETLARKELRFAPVVALQTGASLISLGVGLVMAYLRPDAWALVLAGLSAVLVTTTGAHLFSEPGSLGVSFDWRPLKDLRRYGFLIFINCLTAYIFLRGGDWVIGRLLDVKALALYQMTFLICTTATTEIGGVVSQLAFPVFSHLQQDRDRLEKAFRQALGMISVITMAMAGLVCVCAPDFYPLVLGNQWLAALPLVPWLAIWGVCSLFAGFLGGLFQALGRLKLWVQTVLVMTVLFGAGAIPLTSRHGARGVAILMAGIGVLMQLVRYGIVGRLLSLRWSTVLGQVLIPALAGLFSVWLVTWIRGSLPLINPLAGLIFSAVGLVGFYALFLLLGQRWMDPAPRELFRRFQDFYGRSGFFPGPGQGGE